VRFSNVVLAKDASVTTKKAATHGIGGSMMEPQWPHLKP